MHSVRWHGPCATTGPRFHKECTTNSLEFLSSPSWSLATGDSQHSLNHRFHIDTTSGQEIPDALDNMRRDRSEFDPTGHQQARAVRRHNTHINLGLLILKRRAALKFSVFPRSGHGLSPHSTVSACQELGNAENCGPQHFRSYESSRKLCLGNLLELLVSSFRQRFVSRHQEDDGSSCLVQNERDDVFRNIDNLNALTMTSESIATCRYAILQNCSKSTELLLPEQWNEFLLKHQIDKRLCSRVRFMLPIVLRGNHFDCTL